MKTIKLYIKSIFVKAKPVHDVYPQFPKAQTAYATKRIARKLKQKGYTCLRATEVKQIWFNGTSKVFWNQTLSTQ